MTKTLPSTRDPGPAWSGEAPDPLRFPDYYDGIVVKRMVAFLLDGALIVVLMAGWWVASMMLAIGSLGLLSPLAAVYVLIPLLYDTLLVGGERSATPGMRVMGIEVRRWDGGRPDRLQSALQSLMFYGTVGLTSTLILLVALFNPRRRCLHDYLAGTVTVNRIDFAQVEFRSPARAGTGRAR